MHLIGQPHGFCECHFICWYTDRTQQDKYLSIPMPSPDSLKKMMLIVGQEIHFLHDIILLVTQPPTKPYSFSIMSSFHMTFLLESSVHLCHERGVMHYAYASSSSSSWYGMQLACNYFSLLKGVYFLACFPAIIHNTKSM